ncbi:MAG: hypothetical protein GY720_17505 [bacterium]|nr:hypothetical protein [bacterium]
MGRKIARLGGRLAIAALLAVVLVGVAYGADRWMHRDRVGRNVTVAGFVVGDGAAEDIGRVLRAEGPGVANMPVTIRTEGLVIETTAAKAGVSIDEAAVEAAAFDVRSGEGLVDEFSTWWESLFDEAEVSLAYELDPEPLRRLVEEHPGRVIRHPEEPSFTGNGGGLQITQPVQGAYLDAADVISSLQAAVAAGPPPYTVDVAPTAIPTTHTQTDLSAALAAADDLASRLIVRINERNGIVGAESVRRWIDSEVIDGALTPVFNDERVQTSIQTLFADYAEPLPEPKFTVDEGELHVDLGVPARTCCAPGVSSILFEAAAANDVGAVELPTVLVEDDGGKARADAFGIKEMISTFTTKHSCCQNRVVNIQRIADLVRGQILEPGETLSINDFIGRRTRANGFVSDGVIQSGHFIDEVGGGISQFATTTFNAAFFAGLDIDEYQSHSIYISRYPWGREATLSFPLPDLEITNVAPYAVMLWPTYTKTSITVEMWSTPYFEVEQTRQTSYKIGRCTRVNTYRERTAPDGTVLEDLVFATYRPGEGLDCNGNPTPDPEG